ncbi:unnamed protein product [Paramecium primaurelia]|uniref:Regulator of chromosome condensation 1/beta-lactamase-inhibitor protein II n=1 Tax=Paramecium primaurelia TaxID=5886 RepID=A0A8S1PG68_PARPR|nr:unnamed protein product [Paramecium primaurelia]
MTHVIVSGPSDFNLETIAINNNGIWLNRVVLPKIKDKEISIKFVYIKCCQQNTYMIDINQNLWGFGESLYGQLAERVSSIKTPINLSQLMNVQFLKIDGGNDFVIAYTITKQLYIWGNIPGLKFTQLLKTEKISYSKDIQGKSFEIKGLNITKYFNQQIIDEKSNPPSLHSTRRNSKLNFKFIVDIQDYSAYNNVLYIVTKNLILHSFGKQIDTQIQFCGISCGPFHTLAWEENGNVWSWGEFQDGKLGYMRFDIQEQKEPKLIYDFKAKAIQCVCGANYSIALDVKGDVYTWGKGPFKMDLSKATMPSKIIKKKSPFIKVAAGLDHFGALNSSGQLYVWGSNKKDSIFNFPEEVYQPTPLEIKLKIIDFDMGPQNTGLIIQGENKVNLPLLNFEHFKTEQYKVISEEASLIQTYVNKKNAIEYEKKKSEATSPIIQRQEPQDLNKLIRKNKSLKGSQSSIFHSSTSINQKLNNQLKFPILFDGVHAEVQKMEQESQLYIPIQYSNTDRVGKDPSQEFIELDGVIQTDNDQLKYEYIQLAREKDEEGLLLSILNQVEEKKQDLHLKMPERVQINQFRNKFKIVKPIYHDKYDQFDKSIIQTTKEQIQLLHQERAKKVLQKKRQREQEFERISQISLQSIKPLLNKEQILESIKTKAQENQQKAKLVNLKKEEIQIERANYFTQVVYEKSQEFKQKQKQQLIEKQQRQNLFKELLTFLNIQNFTQICLQISRNVLDHRKSEFLQNISAKKIQHYFRKKYILVKIMNQLNATARKILTSFIVRYKIQLRIKRKQQRIRKLHIFQLRNQVRLKVIIGLASINKAAIVTQQFCSWFNNSISIQLSVLNYYWDEHLLKQFKCVNLNQEKEELKACQSHFTKFIQDEFSYLTNQLLNQDQISKLLKFPKHILLNGRMLRDYISKQIAIKQENERKQKKQFKPLNQILQNQVLLPYTRYIEKIQLPNQYRIKLNFSQIQQLNLMEELTLLECKLKKDVLFSHLLKERRKYVLQMQKFFSDLLEFKEKNKALIGSARIKTFSKLTPQEIQYLKELDLQEKQIYLQKQQNARQKCKIIFNIEKTSKFILKYKQSLIQQINQLNEDQFPYPGLTFKVVEQLMRSSRPIFDINLDVEQWNELFQEYFNEFRARSEKIISSSIRLTTLKIKQESPHKKRSQIT